MKDDPGEAAPTCRFAKDEGGRMKDDPLDVGLKNQVILPRSSFILGRLRRLRKLLHHLLLVRDGFLHARALEHAIEVRLAVAEP